MKIKINQETFIFKEGETILDVAKRNGIDIPSLCYHPDLKNGASCRVCVVEIGKKLQPACSMKAEDGMEVVTNSCFAEKARKINLELLFSQHQEECYDCIWEDSCQMLKLANEYGVKINRFNDRKKNYPVYHFGASLEYDASKCIDCRNCVKVCKNQAVGFLELKHKDHSREVFPSPEEDKDCIYCGQCIIRCPAGAFEAMGEFEEVESPFVNKDKKIVFQIAPAVRTAVGEDFGIPYGESSLKKLVTALKKLGADYVFDVSSGADITTIEESQELVERVKTNNLPLFTACCPSWVKYVEFYYPEFISRLTTTRSPHIILGGVLKNYFAKKIDCTPENIYVVSVMPCVSKKHEITRQELFVDNIPPVDYVMTTREVSRLLKNHNIDLKKEEESEPDNPFGSPTESAENYGVSGGVMQSAYYNIAEKEVAFYEKAKGLKVTTVEVFGKKLNLAVAYGLKNGKKILEELKKDPEKYHFVEVMSCPEGCVGGGGQSVPVDKNIRQKRKEGLCIASGKRKKKKATENNEVQDLYKEFLNNKEIVEKMCHTSYQRSYKVKVKELTQDESKNNHS